MIRLVNRDTGSTENGLPKSAIGMRIRSWGDNWQLQAVYSLLAELASQSPAKSLQRPSKYEQNDLDRASIAKYDKFLRFVKEASSEFTTCVAPSSCASFNLLCCMSTAIKIFGCHESRKPNTTQAKDSQ